MTNCVICGDPILTDEDILRTDAGIAHRDCVELGDYEIKEEKDD